VAAVNALLILHAAVWTLQRFPNAGDEHSYLVSAELFARGKLSVPSPFLAEFYDSNHVINDGRFYGRYPPGWPFLLAAGVLAGVPWLVNPVLGVATLLVLHHLARRHFSADAGNLCLLYLLANPFLIFNSASHFSHPACLFFVALFYLAAFNVLSGLHSWRNAILLGGSAGFAFLIRPLTAVGLMLPVALMFLLRLRKPEGRRAAAGTLGIAAAAFGVFAGLFLLYNRFQTGDAFLMPFNKYIPEDHPHVPERWREYLAWLGQYSVARWIELNSSWIPLCLPCIVFAVADRGLRSDPRVHLLLASLVGVVAAYSFYPTDGGTRYGPRYMYETLGALVLLAGAALARMPRLSLIAVGVVVAINVAGLRAETPVLAREIQAKRDPFILVEQQQIRNAIVFLRPGPGAPNMGDLTRNGTRFSDPVLYVRDLGAHNRDLLDAHPERTPYLYEFLPDQGGGRLTRMYRPHEH
jgi:hypothetical protein